MTQFGEPMGELTATDGFVNISLAWVCERTSPKKQTEFFSSSWESRGASAWDGRLSLGGQNRIATVQIKYLKQETG